MVESKLETTMNRGIRHADVDAMSRELEGADIGANAKATVRDELEEARDRQHDLRQQIDGLRNRLEASRSWIGLDDEHLRRALTSSLGLDWRQRRLTRLPADDGGPERFCLPRSRPAS